MEQQSNQEKSISDALEDVLNKLSLLQIRYVVARQEVTTDKEAAESIGIKPDTVYRWGDEVKEAVRLMELDGLVTARHIRRKALAKAMLVKVKGLDSDDDVLRQRVATEIIEWEMGKATNRTEVGGVEGKPIEVKNFEFTDDEKQRAMAKLLEHAAKNNIASGWGNSEGNGDTAPEGAEQLA